MATRLQFSGSLEDVPLPDIARLFQSTRKTGSLSLRSGNSSGALYFHRGEIIDCHSINMSGLDALKHVALFNRGDFEFTDGASPASQTLNTYATPELITFLESRMQESRQLQELVPALTEIPRYLGGSIPSGLDMNAADLAVALKASAGTHAVWRLASELSLDETTVGYTLARLRAAGLVEIVGTDDTQPLAAPVAPPPLPPKNETVAGSPVSAASSQPRYWRGRKIE